MRTKGKIIKSSTFLRFATPTGKCVLRNLEYQSFHQTKLSGRAKRRSQLKEALLIRIELSRNTEEAVNYKLFFAVTGLWIRSRRQQFIWVMHS